jgi:hypothetical protein
MSNISIMGQNLLPTIFKVGQNKGAVETVTTVEIITEPHLLDYLLDYLTEHFITYQSLNHQAK